MSKIILNKIEAKTTDQDLTISPNGNGIVEVTGDGSDGLLKLKNAQQANSVKIKAPPDSASQNHTLILPDNQIAADKFLKVKSITGSGATAVGQLEYASIAVSNDLNASNLTSGTIPSARLPSSFPATGGAGLKLISKFTISTPVSYIDINDPNNSNRLNVTKAYKIIGKNITTASNTNINLAVHNSNGTGIHGGLTYTYWRFNNYNTSASVISSSSASTVTVGNDSNTFFSFEAEVYPAPGYNYIHWVSWQRDDYRTKAYISFNSSYTSNKINGLRLLSPTNVNFNANSQFLVYQYNED